MSKAHPPELSDWLAQVATQGLSCVDAEVLASMARAVWMGASVPQGDAVQGPHREDAFMLMARLAAFPVVPSERRRRLIQITKIAVGAGYLDAHPELDGLMRTAKEALQSLQAEALQAPGRRGGYVI